MMTEKAQANRLSRRSTCRLTLWTAALFGLIIASWCGPSANPTRALPIYARRYNVTCDTCHTTVPQLNDFGLAFQADHFVWPAGNPPANRLGLDAIPISGMTVYSSVRDLTHDVTNSQWNSLELFASNGFYTKYGPAGYFVDGYTDVGNITSGYLGDAFASVPVGGKHGEFSVTAGQFSPMSYQYDPLNSLTRSLPAALAVGADSFSFTDPTPGVRAEYFSARGHSSADGTYVSFGVPYSGHLSINDMSQWDGPHGYYAHAFRRLKGWSYGAYGYRHDEAHLEGVIGAYEATPNLNLLAAGTEGRDLFGKSREGSVEADYIVDPYISLTGRYEMTETDLTVREDYPVLGVTYFPFRQDYVRILGETIQNNIARSSAIYLIGQF